MIRSHEVRNKGYSQDHPKCMTVFSASCYCNSNNQGAVLEYMLNDSKLRPHCYKTSQSNSSQNSKIVQKNHILIKQFKKLIHSNQKKLLNQFRMFDQAKQGQVKTSIWAEILSSHFNHEISPKHLIYIKDSLCECENVLDLVNYRTMFTQPYSGDKSPNRFSNDNGRIDDSAANQNYLNVVKNLFEIIDKDHNNRISLNEVKEALDSINKKIGSRYSINEDCVNFIRNMDKNGDNEIDLKEFEQAFFNGDTGENNNHYKKSDVNGIEDEFDSGASEDNNEIKIYRV
jgi:Ca2+-binding EF-hand superfamily protein